MKDIKIWQVYHDLSQQESLKEGVLDYYKSYYTKENLNGQSLNHMQKYLNEFVCQYYVYTNNLKSDIVGFCHYGKFFEKKIDDIDCDNNIYAWRLFDITDMVEFNDKHNFIFNSVKSYIEKYYPQFLNKFSNLEYKHNSVQHESFICKWDDFCEYMKFILGYFNYTFMPLELMNNENIRQYADLYYCEYYSDAWWYLYYRRVAYYIEILCGIYFSLIDKNLMAENK